MKTITIYCDHWQNGGVEAYIMNQLRCWNLDDLNCTILSAEKTTDIYDNELRRLNVKQFVLLEGENASPIFRILKTFRLYKKYLIDNPCDIVYLNLTNAVTMRYAKIAKNVGIKRRIVHSHNSGVQPGKNYTLKIFAHNFARKFFTKYATDWWACSNKAAQFLFESNSLKSVVHIPNAIETEKFQFDVKKRIEIRNKLGIKDEKIKVIGTVGRCTEQKNQLFLLEVFAKVHQAIPNTRLLLIGDGPLREMLEKCANRLKITEYCIFYGFTNDVSPFYSAIDVFCLPSVVEGFGIVALEAQVAGCPCLLSDAVSKQVKATKDCDIIFLPLKKDVWETEILDQFGKTNRDRKNVCIAPQYDIKTAAQMTQKKILEG